MAKDKRTKSRKAASTAPQDTSMPPPAPDWWSTLRNVPGILRIFELVRPGVSESTPRQQLRAFFTPSVWDQLAANAAQFEPFNRRSDFPPELRFFHSNLREIAEFLDPRGEIENAANSWWDVFHEAYPSYPAAAGFVIPPRVPTPPPRVPTPTPSPAPTPTPPPRPASPPSGHFEEARRYLQQLTASMPSISAEELAARQAAEAKDKHKMRQRLLALTGRPTVASGPSQPVRDKRKSPPSGEANLADGLGISKSKIVDINCTISQLMANVHILPEFLTRDDALDDPATWAARNAASQIPLPTPEDLSPPRKKRKYQKKSPPPGRKDKKASKAANPPAGPRRSARNKKTTKSKAATVPGVSSATRDAFLDVAAGPEGQVRLNAIILTDGSRGTRQICSFNFSISWPPAYTTQHSTLDWEKHLFTRNQSLSTDQKKMLMQLLPSLKTLDPLPVQVDKGFVFGWERLREAFGFPFPPGTPRVLPRCTECINSAERCYTIGSGIVCTTCFKSHTKRTCSQIRSAEFVDSSHLEQAAWLKTTAPGLEAQMDDIQTTLGHLARVESARRDIQRQLDLQNLNLLVNILKLRKRTDYQNPAAFFEYFPSEEEAERTLKAAMAQGLDSRSEVTKDFVFYYFEEGCLDAAIPGYASAYEFYHQLDHTDAMFAGPRGFFFVPGDPAFEIDPVWVPLEDEDYPTHDFGPRFQRDTSRVKRRLVDQIIRARGLESVTEEEIRYIACHDYEATTARAPRGYLAGENLQLIQDAADEIIDDEAEEADDGYKSGDSRAGEEREDDEVEGGLGEDVEMLDAAGGQSDNEARDEAKLKHASSESSSDSESDSPAPAPSLPVQLSRLSRRTSSRHSPTSTPPHSQRRSRSKPRSKSRLPSLEV
ncbi:hypothetical protein C8R43DRAFT_962782 [Mycena crocata]|nr:hypothetical protein C8R43DRAFT_962782 [Mycena crocata]